jgi:hypothetical protein
MSMLMVIALAILLRPIIAGQNNTSFLMMPSSRCLDESLGFSSKRCSSLHTKTGVASTGSIHLPCSRIRSFNRSTASASGMLNFTAVFPT